MPSSPSSLDLSKTMNDNEKQCDARGLLIPDDIIRNSDLLKSDPVSFWSSNQLYICRNTDPRQPSLEKDESMLKLLAAIPDHHFCHIQSLCLDFGWWSPFGFIPRGGLYDEWLANDNFERLMQNILSRGNKNLVIKLLWTTTMSIPLECKSRWHRENRKWGYENFARPFDERHSDIFKRFKKCMRSIGNHRLRSFGYDDDRVRLITRVIWKDELPDIFDWDWPQEEEYEECQDRIYKIDPISKEYLSKDLWQSVRMSYGLMWDPIQGHFEVPDQVISPIWHEDVEEDEYDSEDATFRKLEAEAEEEYYREKYGYYSD